MLGGIFSRRRKSVPSPTDDQIEFLKALVSTAAKGYQFIENRDKIAINRFTSDASYLQTGSGKVWAAFRACHIVACTLLKVPIFLRTMKGAEPEMDNADANGVEVVVGTSDRLGQRPEC